MQDVPDLPNFSHFHDAYRWDAGETTPEGDMRSAFYSAYYAEGCEYLPLDSPEVDKRLKDGSEMISASPRADASMARVMMNGTMLP